jgi:hypothetical protein
MSSASRFWWEWEDVIFGGRGEYMGYEVERGSHGVRVGVGGAAKGFLNATLIYRSIQSMERMDCSISIYSRLLVNGKGKLLDFDSRAPDLDVTTSLEVYTSTTQLILEMERSARG